MTAAPQMHVASLHRYPVKSMLGESVATLDIGYGGAEGDRRLALIDEETGRVASAKQARLWRHLLKCSARIDDGRVRVRLPDGAEVSPGDAAFVDALSDLLSRPVRLARQRPAGASVERADPDLVLEHGLDAEVDAPLLELAEGTPGESFVDLAPLHVITEATLARIGIDAERYRPNIVIATVRGIGVAVMTSVCGVRSIGAISRSLSRCRTPKRCCSSTITKPRSANSTPSWISACVPTTMSA